MSGPMSPLPPGHPTLVAWEAYKASPEYANTRTWALVEQHVDGSLWAAFVAGRESAQAEKAPGAGGTGGQHPVHAGIQAMNPTTQEDGRIAALQLAATTATGGVYRLKGRETLNTLRYVVAIKRDDGTWAAGVAYQQDGTGDVYVREAADFFQNFEAVP